MKIVGTTKECLSNGNIIDYQVTDTGTHYHVETPMCVVEALEQTRISRQRVRLFLGDPVTGRDWGEEHDVTGYISRSMGQIKIPILLHDSRSFWGGDILDHCIIKLIVDGRLRYVHPSYNGGEYTIGEPSSWRDEKKSEYTTGVHRDGQIVANFKSEKQAERWIAFMKGERMVR